MQQQPILNIKMVPAGIELVVGALRKLPHEQVHGLVTDIWAQYGQQMQQLQAAAQAAPVETEPKPAADTEPLPGVAE